MALTNTEIKNAKATGKPYKRCDASGLFLLVSATGGKPWRFKCAYLGQEKTLALGACLAVGLKKARTARDKARAILAEGRDPSAKSSGPKRRHF